MTAIREVASVAESSIMMLFLGAMSGLRALSAGEQPTDGHRSAWAELADLIERSANEPPPALTAEAILRAGRARLPRTVRQLVSALEEDSPESPVIAERIADFRALARGEAISAGSARGLRSACAHMSAIVHAEARRVAS